MLGVAKTDSEESLYGWEWGESSLTREDKMFFLSARELFDYVANFSYTYLLQATFIGSESDLWGLRSPVRENNSHVGVVSTFGEVLKDVYKRQTAHRAQDVALDIGHPSHRCVLVIQQAEQRGNVA